MMNYLAYFSDSGNEEVVGQRYITEVLDSDDIFHASYTKISEIWVNGIIFNHHSRRVNVFRADKPRNRVIGTFDKKKGYLYQEKVPSPLQEVKIPKTVYNELEKIVKIKEDLAKLLETVSPGVAKLFVDSENVIAKQKEEE